jgi:dTDP-4-amino-4,6-dideoxygalactose transaminase
MYYLILPQSVSREQVLSEMASDGINAVFHYVPLHSAPAGKKFGRINGTLDVTDNMSARLIRLPLWIGLTGDQQQKICSSLVEAIQKQT